jgi:hypothetical protein
MEGADHIAGSVSDARSLARCRAGAARRPVDTAEFKSFNIQDLTVTQLRAAGVTVSDSLKLPRSNVLMKMPLSSIARRG